jgi:hypothetical protein
MEGKGVSRCFQRLVVIEDQGVGGTPEGLQEPQRGTRHDGTEVVAYVVGMSVGDEAALAPDPGVQPQVQPGQIHATII